MLPSLSPSNLSTSDHRTSLWNIVSDTWLAGPASPVLSVEEKSKSCFVYESFIIYGTHANRYKARDATAFLKQSLIAHE